MDHAPFPIDLTLEPSGCDEFDRARALLRDRREHEALDWFELASDAAADPSVRGSAAMHVTSLLLGLGRPHEARAWISRLRTEPVAPGLVDMLEAATLAQFGDYEQMLRVLDASAGDRRDPWFECPESHVTLLRAHALFCLGRADEATAVVLGVFRNTSMVPDLWPALATLCAQSGFSPDPVIDLVDLKDPSVGVRIMGWLRTAEPEGVDRIAETIWARSPGHPAVLAASLRFAPRIDLDRCIEWSVRLLEHGTPEGLPVLTLARDGERPADERIRGAIIAATFAEAEAREALEAAASELADEQLVDVLADVLDAAPELADSLVVAAATTTARCLTIASGLTARGHDEEALAVLVFGLSMPDAETLEPIEFDRLVPADLRARLARVAGAAGDREVADLLASVPLASS